MIRWYDYIAAFIFADFIATWLFIGFMSTTWYMPLIAGAISGYLWSSWEDLYCRWRLRQEIKNGEQ